MPDAPHAEILTIEVFKRLIDVIAKWFHFRGNESDRGLRDNEESLLKKWVQKVHDLGMDHDYHTFLAKLDNDHFGNEKDITRLYREILEIIGSSMEDAAKDALRKKEGINEIFPDGVGEGVKKALLNPSSAVWTPYGNSPAEQILSTAATDPAVQINARSFLDLLRKASNQGTWELSSQEVCEFYNHPSLVAVVWSAAIATELQFRQLKETRKVMEFLISKGISSEQLSTPDWLVAGSKTEQTAQTLQVVE